MMTTGHMGASLVDAMVVVGKGAQLSRVGKRIRVAQQRVDPGAVEQ